MTPYCECHIVERSPSNKWSASPSPGSAEEHATALAISRGLKALKPGSPLSALRRSLEKAGLKVDYVECVDAETLEPRRKVEKGVCVLVAAYCGKTRLIDNRVF